MIDRNPRASLAARGLSVSGYPCYSQRMPATRATLRGHGNPTQIMYFGGDRDPASKGWLVNVVRVRGGANLVDPTGGHTNGWAASATKFWAEPV